MVWMDPSLCDHSWSDMWVVSRCFRLLELQLPYALVGKVCVSVISYFSGIGAQDCRFSSRKPPVYSSEWLCHFPFLTSSG